MSKISPLGFGCMRFVGREDDTIDIEMTSRMIDRYLESGGNYFDTAWAYSNIGCGRIRPAGVAASCAFCGGGHPGRASLALVF